MQKIIKNSNQGEAITAETKPIKTFRDSLREELKDPEFYEEYMALEAEYQEICRTLDAEGKSASSHRGDTDLS